MYQNGVHSSNRVYFCLDVKRARIQVHCFDPDCKREHAKTPIKRALTLIDKHNLTTQFGLPDTLARPRISPVVGEEASGPVVTPITPLAPLVQMSATELKKHRWEEKRRMYQSSVGGGQ
jgi:hypothetical protein